VNQLCSIYLIAIIRTEVINKSAPQKISIY